MSFEDAELLKEFVVESQEHLSDVENQLLSLEEQGDEMDVALVNTVFRAVHSIKGAAGFMGLSTLEKLAHREEEVLNKLRNKELRPTSDVVNVLLRATDRLKNLLDSIESSNDMDVSDHITALQRILSGESAEPVDEIVSSSVTLEAEKISIESPKAIIEIENEVVEPTSADARSIAPVEVAEGTDSPKGLSVEALHEFLVESFDNVEQIERDLMSLERNPDEANIINGIFRNVHTIKGTSGFLGFTRLERVTHRAEDLLGAIRSKQITMSSEIAGALLTTIDAVREMLRNIENFKTEGINDYVDLIILLKHLQSPPKRAKPKAKSASNDITNNSPSLPDSTPCSKVEMTSPPNTERSLNHVSRPAESQAPTNTKKVSEGKFNASEPLANKESTKQATADASVSESTIRVDVSLLDKLMTCVGELVLARNQILQFSNVSRDNELYATSQRLNLITTELQESVMKTRMQPIGNVWSKFPRLVRDLSAICEKEVRVEMQGKETELDKTIIEAIKDPLTHLVRNTVDHGIEKPSVRIENGKPAEGCLTLKAYHEGGRVNIEICDDGAGLNLERIRSKAVEKTLITQEQASRLSEREVAQLIFLPGFSTAEKVSNVSGRGVGMDVVKTNIEKIGGTVDIQTQSGIGTTIKIKIPLTLAIIPALIVTNDENRYAIPQVNLLELLRLDGADAIKQIEWVQGAPVYRLRGRLLPLVFLCEVLGTGTHETMRAKSDAYTIVVLKAEDQQFGLIVDRVNDSEEIVVKPLSKQLKGIPLYSGTTIMGDGKVALILDVVGAAQIGKVVSQRRDRSMSEQSLRTNRVSETQTLLVVAAGRNGRCAMPLSQVTRLEKFETKRLEYSNQMRVIQYRDEILPLRTLSEILGIEATEKSGDREVDVVVYSENGKSIGIMVEKIIDIIDVAVTLKNAKSEPGRLGSMVIADQVTDMLDLSLIMKEYENSLA
jgi:two-component system, chemotaxis family, sensor kinase CheA